MRSENPRRSGGVRLVEDQTDKTNSVVDDHLSLTLITQSLERHTDPFLGKGSVRPCMRVRIYSLHSRLATSVFPKGICRLSASAFLWSPLSSRTTGVTRYLFTLLFLH